MIEFNITDGVAVLHLDDGKANALSHALVSEINDAMETASNDAKAVVIIGRNGMFSGGFDLLELQKGPDAALALVNRGAEMLNRVFTHPQPVVAGCTGHAIAAGALLLLACDTRIGSHGEYRIGLNETAIGMALPVFGLELAKARLSRRHLTAAVIQATIYDPEGAVDAGFLDRTTPVEGLLQAAVAEAARLADFPADAYAANKLGIRRETANVIRASLA
ncbi:MAG: crotonase/enoyl-CoA hydratase family protein [Gammaproteobacteria bacterium]|nr:crotonase/enoyl-CoA hydratase family protein [Gammaproteobacteria bacterium]